MLLLMAVFSWSCDEKEKPLPPMAPEPAQQVDAGEDPASLDPTTVAVEETIGEDAASTLCRTEVLGFARHLPANIEGLITVQNLQKTVEDVKRMKLWKAVNEEVPDRPFQAPDAEGGEDFSDLDGILHEDDFDGPGMTMMSPMEMFGREATLALGAGGGARLAAWLEFNARSSHYQMRNLAAALSGKPVGDDAIGTPFSLITALFGAMSDTSIYADLVQDRAAMRAMDAFQIPPIYLAVRAEGEKIHEVHAMLSEPVRSLTSFGEMVAPVEVTRAGVTFQGYRLIGADLATSMAEGSEFMVEIFGEEVFDKLINFVKSRELVALSGVVGDYSVLFFGASADEFVLAESPEMAITHGDALAFADPLLAHPQLALLYGGESMIKQVAASAGGLAEIALGLRDGFASNDRDGRNRDLVAMLQVVAERERALRALARYEASGVILVDDGGPRLESHGSTDGMLDFASHSRLAALGDDPDAAMFFNLCADARYSERSMDYMEALFETGYALMMRIMEVPADTPPSPFDPFAFLRQQTLTFNNDFRGDLVNIWRSLAHDVRNGLGHESAVIVDLKGTVPALPGAAKPLAGIGNSPRVTYLAPVTDREKLASAWPTIHQSASRIVARAGELSEREFPMPNAVRSETGGLSSWFLPLPYFDDEFLPAVTLDDSWFAVGTSRNQSVELIQRLGDLAPRDGGGMRFHVNFPRIVEAQRAQMTALAEKRDAILEAGDLSEEEFDSTLKSIESIVNGLEDFGRLEARSWEENGVVRSRIHLRMNR